MCPGSLCFQQFLEPQPVAASGELKAIGVALVCVALHKCLRRVSCKVHSFSRRVYLTGSVDRFASKRCGSFVTVTSRYSICRVGFAAALFPMSTRVQTV